MSVSSFDSTPRLKKTPKSVSVAPSTPQQPSPVLPALELIPPTEEESYPYWMVWARSRKGWKRMPKAHHLTPESATAEASRLATLRPGRKFHIVRIEGMIQIVPTKS